MHFFIHRARRAVAALTLGIVIVAAVGNPASAHVSVNSFDAKRQEFGKITFRVPNESATAKTVKVAVTLPTDTPFAFVSAKPIAGWKVESTTTTLAKPITTQGTTVTKGVSMVTWSTESVGIADGEFQEFELSVGPFPDRSSLQFPTTQTYSDGNVVTWNQQQAKGADEPEHPVPTLTIASEHVDTSTSDVLARSLGGVAVVVALLALAATLRRQRA